MLAPHSKGPWQISSLCPVIIVQVLPEFGEHIVRNLALVAVAGNGTLSSAAGRAAIADAKIMAAGLDLLTAAEEAARHLRRVQRVDGMAALVQLDAAIAKARN